MNTIETNKVLVVAVCWSGVTVEANGRPSYLTWETLHAAANQDEPELHRVYSEIRDQARRMAAEKKAMRIVVCNTSRDEAGNVPTWSAGLVDMAGQHVSGRIIAADWGQTGVRSYAERDAAEARTKLSQRGYEVR